jgi:hypothetical protein
MQQRRQFVREYIAYHCTGNPPPLDDQCTTARCPAQARTHPARLVEEDVRMCARCAGAGCKDNVGVVGQKDREGGGDAGGDRRGLGCACVYPWAHSYVCARGYNRTPTHIDIPEEPHPRIGCPDSSPAGVLHTTAIILAAPVPTTPLMCSFLALPHSAHYGASEYMLTCRAWIAVIHMKLENGLVPCVWRSICTLIQCRTRSC